jgi:signal transduction histidine kinase
MNVSAPGRPSPTAVLAAIERAHRLYFRDGDRPRLFERMLDDVLLLTGCEYGFIGEILHHDDGTPYLKSWALTDISWDEPTKALYESTKGPDQGLVFENLNTLFGRVIASATPLISNDAPNDPRRGGLPPGHPPLHSFLGLPLMREDEMIGMVGVANHPAGFSADDISSLEPYLAVCAHMIDVIRSDRERAAAQAAEREARAIVERQERLSYIGRLASGVAHDMNNLITMVSLQCDLLETNAALPSNARSAVERIQQVCQSAAGMTARLQRLRVTSTGPGRCAAVPAVRSALPLLESIVGEGIVISNHLELGDSVEVALADSELMQVLLNLVSNAADALAGEGRIDIRLAPTLMASGRGAVELTVADSGPGVPEHLRAVLFDPFASTKGEGRGLGLPTVRTLVESCGGRIQLLERDLPGAVFRIELPLATQG